MNKKELNKKFRYDPETGKLYPRKPRKGREGKEAGTHVNNGYRQVKVDGKFEYVHIVIWKMHYGVFDKQQYVVLHKNGDPADNRIENLEKVGREEAGRRPRKHVKPNKMSKYRGVSLVRRANFRASITHGDDSIYIGLFETEEEAAKAYDKWAKDIHKEFAILNFPDD